MDLVIFSEDFLNDILKIEHESFTNPWNMEMFLGSAQNKTVIFKILINIPLGNYGRKPVEEKKSQDLFFRKYAKIDRCKKGNKLTACIDANIT